MMEYVTDILRKQKEEEDKLKEAEDKKRMKKIRQKCNRVMPQLTQRMRDFKDKILNVTRIAEERNRRVNVMVKSAALNIKRIVDREVSGIKNGPDGKKKSVQ
jgi:hypothetical protein